MLKAKLACSVCGGPKPRHVSKASLGVEFQTSCFGYTAEETKMCAICN